MIGLAKQTLHTLLGISWFFKAGILVYSSRFGHKVFISTDMFS